MPLILSDIEHRILKTVAHKPTARKNMLYLMEGIPSTCPGCDLQDGLNTLKHKGLIRSEPTQLPDRYIKLWYITEEGTRELDQR